jgi:THO complex subunit 2
VLWILGFGLERKREISQQPQNSAKLDQEHIQIYSNTVNSLIRHKIVETTTLIESLNEANLVDCGLIPDQDSFIKKISRLNTKMIYEQQKYNLLREESEGFSKLIFLLFEVKFTKANIHKYIDKIFSLIGFFDLDPNRVLDINLSAFETDCDNLCFLEILKLLNLNALPHVLGFKLANIYAGDNGQNQKPGILINNFY